MRMCYGRIYLERKKSLCYCYFNVYIIIIGFLCPKSLDENRVRHVWPNLNIGLFI